MPPSKERRDIRNLVLAGDLQGARTMLLDFLATNPPMAEKTHVKHALRHLNEYIKYIGLPVYEAINLSQLERVKEILNRDPDPDAIT